MTITRRSLCLGLGTLATMLRSQGVFGADISPYRLMDKRSALAKGRFASLTNRSKALEPRLVDIIAGIDRERIRTHILQLQNFRTRYSLAQPGDLVTNWLVTKFTELGGDPAAIKLQPWQMPSGQKLNNVLRLPNAKYQSFALVCAHYDSTSEIPNESAPGADDDASGIAILLEVVASLRDVNLQRGVLVAAFGGEEQGLIGSQACAEIAAREHWPIDIVINLDMVGYQAPGRQTSITIEFDQGNIRAENDAAAKSFALQMAQIAADYTALNVEHTDIWNSDYMPFEARGFPCVGLYDGGADGSFYHTSRDVIDIVNEEKLVEVGKLVVASVVSICGFASNP